jgi:ABC-type multidrug transport system fused ATPase/permease subunit
MAEEAHIFGSAAAHEEAVDQLIDATRVAFFRYQWFGRLAPTIYQSLMISLIVAGLAGIYASDAGSLASLGGAVLLLARAGVYGQQLQSSYHGAHQAIPYLDRLSAAVVRYRLSTEIDSGKRLSNIREVACDHLGFAYSPGRPVLRDVTFSINAGEAVGIVGPSGAGKSTLMQIMLRLRVPDSGSFLVNGESSGCFARADWQQRVAYVSQDPRVFQGTVADNIRYFRDLNHESVERAARLAHIHDEIAAMPAGYDTVIGQRADAVSGGQRQRICLARALAATPDVLMLDEPTSALDPASEAAVQASLVGLHRRLTLIIVAHRLSTLAICDRVLVISDGTVAAFAPMAELTATNDFVRLAAGLSRDTA